MTDPTIAQSARQARDVAISFILEGNDPEMTLALLDGLCLTSPEVVGLISEVTTLRGQGAPASSYRAWHADLCALLRRLVQQSLEADAEAERRSRAVPDAMAALGYGNATGDR
jgi:hypothetical protein